MHLAPQRLFQPRRTLLLVLAINALALMIGALLASQPLALAGSAEVRVPLTPERAGLTTGSRWPVLLLADGGAIVNGHRAAPGTVAEVIRETVRSRPGEGVRLEAEGGVTFARLRLVMEICAAAGLGHVDVATNVEAQP